MVEQHFVVIGNGPAGNQAALTLRRKIPEARITLISRDHGGSYRPHLLPRVVSGEIPEDRIYVFSPSSYKDKNIKLRHGQEVVGIDLKKRELTLDHKEIIPFNGLIIAVGGQPRIPENYAVFKDLLFTLKTPQNARAWMEKLSKTESVLVIGGDLTSFAFTKVLLEKRKKVYFFLTEEALWPLQCRSDLIENVSDKLEKKGVDVFTNSKINGMSLLHDGSVDVIINNQHIHAGIIGAFFGLVPDIGFAVKSGLLIDRGILVDEYLNAGVEGIYATGDCAQIYHPELRDYWVSIGHDNAVMLGRIAAMNLAGENIKIQVDKESIFNRQGINVNTSWWTEF